MESLTTTFARLLVRAMLVVGCAVPLSAQNDHVTITSATGPASDESTVDIKADLDPQGGTLRMKRIEWYDAAGALVGQDATNSEWTSATTTSWTFTNVPKGAVKCRIFHSNGISNGGVFVNITRS